MSICSRWAVYEKLSQNKIRHSFACEQIIKGMYSTLQGHEKPFLQYLSELLHIIFGARSYFSDVTSQRPRLPGDQFRRAATVSQHLTVLKRKRAGRLKSCANVIFVTTAARYRGGQSCSARSQRQVIRAVSPCAKHRRECSVSNDILPVLCCLRRAVHNVFAHANRNIFNL